MAKRSTIDPAVITAAINGDRIAFGEIYLHYRSLVFSVCQRAVHNPTIAEELAHDTFVLVLRKMQLFKGQSQFGTWLYQIARNTALMYIRDQQRKDCHESFGSMEDDKTKIGQLERVLTVRDDGLHAVPERVTLERAIGKLAPGYCTAFLLHDIHGYEHNEISEIMNVRQGTSKSQLHKGRKKLREMLDAA